MTRDGEGEGATVILTGDAEGPDVTGDAEGELVVAVIGDTDGIWVAWATLDISSSSESDSHGVLGKHASPCGHSELLPPGHGLRQLVEAS